MTKQNCLVDEKGHQFPTVSTNQNVIILNTGIESHVSPPENKYLEFTKYERIHQHELTDTYLMIGIS